MIRPLADIPGLWPSLRHDDRLSGHQSLAGDVVHPEVLWRHRLTGPVFDGRSMPSSGGADLFLLFGGCLHRYDGIGRLVWRATTVGLESVIAVEDVDGDGRIEILASTGKSLVILDSSNGIELWRTYLGPPSAGGFMQTAARLFRITPRDRTFHLAVGLLSSREVVIFDFASGAAAPERRHLLWMDDFFHPSLLALDVDGDGRTELVVTKLSSIFVFDPETGRLKSECRWSSGGTPKRNYGVFRAVDLSGNGLPDFVVISDRVSRHIAVVGNDGAGRLHVLWDRFVEHIYDTDETELRAVPEACLDIDGDRRQEIIVSHYNVNGDGRWWLEVIDATTGSTRGRYPDLYLRGMDVEGEASPSQVYVSTEYVRVPAPFSSISILRWIDDELRPMATLDGCAFMGRFPEPADDRSQFRTDLPPSDGVWIPWIDAEPQIVVRQQGSGLVLWSPVDGTVRPIDGTAAAEALVAADDFDGDGRTELALSDIDGRLRFVQADGTVTATFKTGLRLRPGSGPYYAARPASVPIVFADADGRYCALPDAAGRIHLLRWDAELGRPTTAWSLPGRGRMGPEESYHSVTAAELDGLPVVLFAPLGEAELIARDLHGAVRGRWAVPRLPRTEALPAARTGIHEYIVHGSGEAGVIIVSGFASSSMNSERSCGIDPATGAVLWEGREIQVPGHVLAFAPWSAASLDPDPPFGRLLFLAKDTLCEVDPATGTSLRTPWQLRPLNTAAMQKLGLTMDDFTAYGSLLVADVDGDGRAEWVLIGNYGGHGVLDAEHRPLWWHAEPLSSLTASFGGLTDVDSDGLPELGVSTAAGDFICLAAATGIEKWRLHIGDVAHGIATCDIDGDGRSEFVLSTREGRLLCIGVGSAGMGLLKWSLDFGYTLGAPVLADLDGDGRTEILVVSGDGYLNGVGRRRR